MTNDAPTLDVQLDGVSLPLVAGSFPVWENIAQFPPKSLIGSDIRAQDHSLLSPLSLSNFAGLGRFRYRTQEEGVERFWTSTLDTRYANLLLLPPLRFRQSLPATVETITGGYFARDFYQPLGGWVVLLMTGAYATIGYPNLTYDGSTQPYSPASAVQGPDAAAITDVTQFRRYTLKCYGPGQFYTYRAHSGAIAANGTIKPTFMVPVGTLLFAFVDDSAGSGDWLVYDSTKADNTAVWTLFATLTQLEQGESVKAVAAGFSADGFPALFCATTRRVLQLDTSSQNVTEIYTFPKLALAPKIVHWERTRAMYVTDGDRNLWELASGSVRNISPYRDEGVPAAPAYQPLAGKITSVFRMQNWLGVTSAQLTANDNSTCLLYDGTGWHVLAVSGVGPDGAEATATKRWVDAIAHEDGVLILEERQVQDTIGGPVNQRNRVIGLWAPDTLLAPWVAGGLPASYEPLGDLVTPWFDADLPELYKLGVVVDVLGVNFSSTNRLTVYYQTDGTLTTAPNWVLIGSTSGATVVEGVQRILGATAGLKFKRIQYLFRLQRGGTTTDTPVVLNVAPKFLLRPQLLNSWRIRVDARVDVWKLKTGEQLRDHIRAVLSKPDLVAFSFGRQAQTMVAVSAAAGQETVDPQQSAGIYNLSLLQPIADSF